MNLIFFILCVSLLSSHSKPTKHIHALSVKRTTAMKGITAILILLNHCANHTSLDGKMPFLVVGYYGVALFFFLSGYGVCKAANTGGVFAFFLEKSTY